jgi:hypothetical protein
MSTTSIAVSFSGCNFPPAAAKPDLPASGVSWRKCLLLNRSALLSAWPRYFPRHSFYDLHLISRASSWDDPGWARAARSYHEERRKRGCL